MPDILPENERLLLQRASDGDEEAFASLFHAYRDKLFSFIYRLSQSRETAEDVVQDVFLKIWQQRGRLNVIDNFNAFLYRMSYNHTINLLKRSSKETLVLMEASQRQRTAPALPDEQLIYDAIQQYIADVVSHLPPQQKAVYTLSREEHLKQDEIARRLDISLSTVQNHMTQALRTIREKLSGKRYPGS